MFYTTFKTPLGAMVVSSDGEAITGVYFLGQRYFTSIPKTWVRDSKNKILVKATEQVAQYFAGKRKKFVVPLFAEGTAFQKKVWRALEQIPYGTRTSYGAIAKKIGKPKAVRAVGSAVGKNPHCIVVPCHRVLGAHGALGGYAGGLARKVKLLKIENKK